MKKNASARQISSFGAAFALAVTFAHAETQQPATQVKEIKGEILDLTCYADHGATGEKHASCGTTCVKSGLPVGIKAEDGTVYTVVGEHKPLNQELAPYVGKIVTLKGKVSLRSGFNLLQNAELVK